MTDARDGSMTGITGPMPPLQAAVYGDAPDDWRPLPPYGIHEAILRSLTERRAIETRWVEGRRQWRKTVSALIDEGARVIVRDGTMICMRGGGR